MLNDLMLIFFFFQAEDGIRDLTVTGVQTCALPIYPHGEANRVIPSKKLTTRAVRSIVGVSCNRAERRRKRGNAPHGARQAHQMPVARSEERRVGKEWRSGRSAEH